MIVNISFNFNSDTFELTNIKVTPLQQELNFNNVKDNEIIPSEEKNLFAEAFKSAFGDFSKPSKPKASKKLVNDDGVIKLDENKLILTQSIADSLNAEPGDRLSVRFKEYDGVYYPIIAKSEVFGDPESGNKLTKSFTISYRGKQREELVIYGDEFKYEFDSNGICKLIGNKQVIPDNSVFKSNQDLDSFDLDDSDNNLDDKSKLQNNTDKRSIDTKDDQINSDNTLITDNSFIDFDIQPSKSSSNPIESELPKFTYTSELPTDKDVVNDKDVNIDFNIFDSIDLDEL